MTGKKRSSIGHVFKALIKEISTSIWTLVGFFATWLVLTGTAKTVIGQVGLVAIVIWIVGIALRIELPKRPQENEPDGKN